ncbi:MAG TPA: DEAD/DEAH box helicase [Pseudobdellovibrionaceae bacterium]|nr:DEAD/DEAH box helicase [Pseudobdellovibrionaceae bacterium]
MQPNWVSPLWRPNDVPLLYHPDHGGSASRGVATTMEWMDAEAQCLQYLFADGLCLTAAELLRHPRGREIPRPLLPLSLQLRPEFERAQFAHRMPPGGLRPHWLATTDHCMASVLAAVERLNKTLFAEDGHEVKIYFTTSVDKKRERTAVRLDGLDTRWAEGALIWRISTNSDSSSSHADRPEASPRISRGEVRVRLDVPDEFATDTYRLDPVSGRLQFHNWRERLDALRAQLSLSLQVRPEPVVADIPGDAASAQASAHLSPSTSSTSGAPGAALQSQTFTDDDGSLRVRGHAQIQALIRELENQTAQSGDRLLIEPRQLTLAPTAALPRLAISGDATFRLRFAIQLENSPTRLEAHGFPRAMNYLIYLLHSGFGATTGFANTQIAHQRRGLKRERDLKLLRHIGFANLLFFEAASLALGLPGSDGELIPNAQVLRHRLYLKFAAFVSKGDQWNPQAEHDEPRGFEHLVSEGLIALLDGLIDQILDDGRAEKSTHIYIPEGEIAIPGVSRNVLRLLRALVGDLANETAGACFTKVRSQAFENFFHNRPGFDREDWVIRPEISAEADARLIYTPGVNERFVIPTAKLPPRGAQLLSLAHFGFELSLDGKSVEKIREGEFRPEFQLTEGVNPQDVQSLALGNRKIDWFELHPKFFFKGKELAVEDALRLSREGVIEFEGRYYLLEQKELPSLKRLTRFWESLHGGGDLLAEPTKRRRTEETFFQLPRSRALELLALRASGIDIQGGERWKEICEFYDRLDQLREPLQLPDTFKAQLQPYQMTGVQWLDDIRRLGLGGILADDMGLGKTVTSLAFLEMERCRGRLGPTLILVPTSLTYNWLSEAARFAPELRLHLFNSRDPEGLLDFVRQSWELPNNSADRHSGVVISTYGLVQENVDIFRQVKWDIAIFDEAQALKTITTKRTTAVRQLDAGFKICLTGTPLENHYGEFYSLFDLCVPGALGELPAFRERFVNPVRVMRDDLDELKQRTKPLLLRRTKQQVMSQLPEKREITLKLPFEDEQRRIYRDIATSYNRQIRDRIANEGEGKTQLQMLTALLRLRQVCSDPSGVPGVQYQQEPPKISTLIDAITEVVAEGASALIFTQFLATFQRLRDALQAAGVTHFDMSGQDSRVERERKLRAFEEHDGGAVMLMTLKTGGVGLNLVKATYVFHVEPWWNPAVENQATDRAHRIGQTKSVQVYRYIIQDSVEEKIEILKELKSKRFDALFGVTAENVQELETTPTEKDEIGQGNNRLSQKDFEFLLS